MESKAEYRIWRAKLNTESWRAKLNTEYGEQSWIGRLKLDRQSRIMKNNIMKNKAE
jgi:hypothetical protein